MGTRSGPSLSGGRDTDRRRLILSAAALSLSAPAIARSQARLAPQASATATYDYVFMETATANGVSWREPLVAHLTARRAALQAAGGEVVGLFAPQLGWRSHEAALLVRWTGPRADRRVLDGLLRTPLVSRFTREPLTPTVRPGASERPAVGGIYVHRWFEVAARDVPEFVDLSVQGWRDFEVRFDTRIFGLFTAALTATERREGRSRLLLLTRYASHGVWEQSRDPSTEAMAMFRRRQQLTRTSGGSSTTLVPLPGLHQGA
jgi:hypothetical protein